MGVQMQLNRPALPLKFESLFRIRALKIYEKQNQANAIDFVNYVIDKFPFRIHTIQTENGHEFQSKFNWHLNDHAVHHRYIKPRTPKHNGKVERSHKTDKMEFYQLLDYTMMWI